MSGTEQSSIHSNVLQDTGSKDTLPPQRVHCCQHPDAIYWVASGYDSICNINVQVQDPATQTITLNPK